MRIKLVWVILSFCASEVLAQNISGFSSKSAKVQHELETKYLALPKAKNAEAYLFRLTEEPHIAGSAAGKAVAEYIHSKYVEWGLYSKLVEYQVYLTYPETVRVTLLEPDTVQLDLREPSWKFDKDSYDSRAVMPFNAYSPSGDVTGQIVYVNRGLPEDYESLSELGIDVAGKIMLARYGGSFRGVKAKVAEEHAALGLILYSDPADDGYMKGDVYPNGPMRPAQAIQRGSLLYLFNYPGDPLTPGFASVKNAKRIKPEEATNIPTIPTVPIAYAQARRILNSLAGPEVPDNWQGGLPLRYHVGPGPAKINLKLQMDTRVRPIYNVITRIEGSEEPEKMIIIGNHHDAWVYGAVDPNSGTASVMEIGRSLGELLKQGWQPKRTIVLAHWDAEEYGLIGSTEWVEENKAELVKNAVLYINIDAAVSGENFRIGAVPSLDAFIREVAQAIEDPVTGNSVYERWWADENKEKYKKLNGTLPDTAMTKVGRLGSGSDYSAFLQHAGVPALSMSFGGRYGVYHSILDNFYWMKNWGDPTFRYHETMAKIGGLMALRFAQADIFPFDYANYADAISKHIDELEKSLREDHPERELSFSDLKEKVMEWQQVCVSLNENIQARLDSLESDERLNDALMKLERSLVSRDGLAGRPWFKHRIYAPGLYTGYAAKPLPGIAEAAEEADWQTAEQEIATLMSLLGQAIETVRTSISRLGALTE